MANFWYALAAGCGVGTVVISVGILAWQAFQWLEFGIWLEVPAHYALDYFQLPYPVVSWVGVQKMIDGFLQWPLSVAIFVVGMGLAWLFGIFGSDAEKEEMRRKNKVRG